jgi:hypothetical protein
MKRRILIFVLLLVLSLSFSSPVYSKDNNAAAKLAKTEAKLEKALGTNTNWKPTVFKNLRYGMPCTQVRKYFKGLKCSSFKKYDFPKVSGKLFGAVKEFQFTFKYGKLESATIIFGSRLFDAKRFQIALLNVAQRKWGKLSPEKLNKKYKYWYNADRDSVSLSYYKSNYQLKVTMPKRDTGDVKAGFMSANDVRTSLAKLLGSSKNWAVPAMSKFKRNMYCGQILQVYKTMKGCNPVKNYSWGTVTIKDHTLVHALKFTFHKGQLRSAALIFHRQLDKSLFKGISQQLFQQKWGKLSADKLNKDILTIYRTNYGIAQRSFSVDHWEIKHDFPK